MSQIVISALGPSIQEQCDKLGITPTKMKIETIDSLSHWLTVAHIHAVLTDAEVHRARLRLLKRAKFAAKDTQEQPK